LCQERNAPAAFAHPTTEFQRLKEIGDMTVNALAPRSGAPKSGTMDVDRFMAFVHTRPKGEHWHLIDGVAVMMAPASYAHRQIALNLCILLRSAFGAQGLDLRAVGNVGVRSPGTRYFQPEPDVAVVPGVAGYDLYSERFQLAAEILSPSNSRQEIDLKLDFYREAPHNLYAVVIEPREFRVEIYAKSRKWEPVILEHPDDAIEMPEFGLRCLVADLYLDTPLDPRRGAAPNGPPLPQTHD
jgi:Uma2 family endonuclease